jgi:hypothetical protein
VTNLLPYVQQSQGYFQAEWSSMLFLLVVGIIYVLVPVIGYSPAKRGLLVASMWALVVKLAIGIFRDCLASFQYATVTVTASAATSWNVAPVLVPPAPAGGAPIPPPPITIATSSGGLLSKFEEQLPAILALTEMVAFLAAIILFVYGLQRLVRREPVAAEIKATET